MEGGLGDDLAYVNQIGDVVVELADGGSDRIIAAISWVLDDNVERLSLAADGDLNGTGNALANRIDGNARSNILSGGEGADSLYGGDGADTLLGGAGADALTGGAGADHMEGGTGNDLYRVDDVADEVVELADGGNDRIISTVDWTLADEFEHLSLSGTADLDGTGNSVANRLEGNAGANLLDGADGDDTIYGQGGTDTLIGGGGADLLSGDAGEDHLQGGLGADRFLFQGVAEANGDVIADFNALEGDRIDLRPMDANANVAGNQAFVFIGALAFGSVAGQLHFVGGFIEGDVDGDGLADFQVEVSATASLAASNFWL
jgi:Ca2+-binding RTX toxin-like protein